jgi:hypothetical protein
MALIAAGKCDNKIMLVVFRGDMLWAYAGRELKNENQDFLFKIKK